MAFLSDERFTFNSYGLPPETFGVVSFKGREGLSQCYEFEIDLVSDKDTLDLDRIVARSATFTIIGVKGRTPFHGILLKFEQLHKFNQYVFYRAILTPRLWWLKQTHHNQVFLDTKLPDLLTEVLLDGGLTVDDFEVRLLGQYPSLEYVCQYRESHFNFICRWMEREGVYYFFEQGKEREKLILTDHKLAHGDLPVDTRIYYSAPSGLDVGVRDEVVHSFRLSQQMLPNEVIVNDYNYEHPTLSLAGRAEVKSNGRGQMILYGENCRSPEEGAALAKIRAEAYLCQEKTYFGQSLIPYMKTGYVFEMEDHYRQDFNQKYLTVEVEHRGSQAGLLVAGLKESLAQAEENQYYENSFTAIPAKVQFRPQRMTEKPRFYGVMNAHVDAAQSGEYAELDQHGRYKVLLPFDLSGRKDGAASAFFRMAQPYAGPDQGMHFPLRKGTEVLLTFIDGDPDRPIISAAVPNAVTPSVVNSKNSTMAGFRTGGGNSISMEDQDGSQRIVMQSGDGESVMKMGRSSPDSELFTATPFATNYLATGATDLLGSAKTVIAGYSHTTVTGKMWFSVLMAAVHTAVGAIPGLVKSSMRKFHFQKSDALLKKKYQDIEAAQEHLKTLRGRLFKSADEKQPLTDDDLEKITSYIDLKEYGTYDIADLVDEIQQMQKKPPPLTLAEKNRLNKILEDMSGILEEKKQELEETSKKEDEIAESYLTGSKNMGLVIDTIMTITAGIIDQILGTVKGSLLTKGVKHNLDEFIYMVVHHNGNMIVSQKSEFSFTYFLPWNWAKIWKHFKTPSIRPKGMIFYEGKGPQVFYADKNFEVLSGERAWIDAKDTDVAATDKTNLFGATVRVAGYDGLELRTGYKPTHLKRTLPTDSPKVPEGINLVAGAKHNIEIAQAAFNNDGEITINSNKKVKIFVGDNEVAIDKSEISIKAAADSSIVTKKDGIKLETKPVLGTDNSTVDISASGCEVSGGKGSLKTDPSGATLEGHGNQLVLSVAGVKVNGKNIKLG